MGAVTKRCICTATRLLAEGRYNGYEAVFDEWVKDPVIEVLPEEELTNPAYYLSHDQDQDWCLMLHAGRTHPQ